MTAAPHPPDWAREEEAPSSEPASVLELSAQPDDEQARRSRLGAKKRRHLLDLVAGIVVSSACAGLGVVVVDRVFRPEWDIASGNHWLGAPILCVSIAVSLGMLLSVLVLAERAVASAFPGSAKLRDAVQVGCHALMAGMLVWSTAVWTFSGKAVSETWLGTWGPPAFLVLLMGLVALSSWLGVRADRRVFRGRYKFSLWLGGLFLSLAGLAFWVDMNFFVSLYDRLHTLLEVAAFAWLMTAFQAWGVVLWHRAPRLRQLLRPVALGLVVLSVSFVAYRPLRNYTDSLLPHAWVDEVYVGRALKRTHMVELKLDGGESLEMARVQNIVDRFKVPSTQLDPRWLEPAPPPSPASLDLRGGKKNVVFFYVDTLRADVARDPRLMPHVAKFAKQSLSFQNAYSSGSDTLRSLPALTGGNNFVQHSHQHDLLALAKKSDHESVVIGSQSALQFLEKHRSPFEFERSIPIEDYEEGKDVWGYGADLPTASRIVDSAIEILNEKREDENFFLWMYHFDQHAWRELDEAHVSERREALGVAEEGKLDVRYRVVARSIDEEFGRFMTALDASKHAENTVVVFVSDHGEGLGRDGFWVHSVFLWEDLIHVPLLIRAPGVTPRSVETPVGLVDVAPSLAPYLGLEYEPALYHGVDLFEFALGNEPARRLPLLLRGASRDRLERVGLIDTRTHKKLVLRLESAFPELYSIPRDRGEKKNLARRESALMSQWILELVRSPVFPRVYDDFALLTELGEIQVQSPSEPVMPPSGRVDPGPARLNLAELPSDEAGKERGAIDWSDLPLGERMGGRALAQQAQPSSTGEPTEARAEVEPSPAPVEPPQPSGVDLRYFATEDPESSGVDLRYFATENPVEPKAPAASPSNEGE